VQIYLREQRQRAAQYYERAAQALPDAQRKTQRHLLVLAALGRRHVQERASAPSSRRLTDMLLAWRTARRAQR
jgi:hypothetical protein